MSKIVSAYRLEGDFDYGISYGSRKGNMIGSAVRYADGKLVGIVEDSDRSSDKGTKKYLLGQFHQKGLSVLKIPPMDRGMLVVAWALQEKSKDKIYSGGWVPLQANLSSFGLSASPSLQSVASINTSLFSILSSEPFGDILGDAIPDSRVANLLLREANLKLTREDLRL